MTVVLRGHLLLAPASIAAGAVATTLGLVLMWLAHQAAGARALRTLTLMVGHADKWLHKAGAVDKSQGGETMRAGPVRPRALDEARLPPDVPAAR